MQPTPAGLHVRKLPLRKRAIIFVRTEHPLFLRCRSYRRKRHLPISDAEYSIGETIDPNDLAAIKSTDSPKLRQKKSSGMVIQVPFDNCASQIPCNVRRSRKEVIVAVRVRVKFDNLPISSTNPFVRLHASVGQDWRACR